MATINQLVRKPRVKKVVKSNVYPVRLGISSHGLDINRLIAYLSD